ncbi:MAG: phage tail tape measure protein [Pseudogulbenkiania sp.]|nr:phage tail tape measure protein [Pseudogulbenkiania sp.]
MTEPSAPSSGGIDTAATLALEITTGGALGTLLEINAQLDRLSRPRTINAGKLEFKEFGSNFQQQLNAQVARIQGARKAAAAKLSEPLAVAPLQLGTETLSNQAAATIGRLGAEINSLKSQLATAAVAADQQRQHIQKLTSAADDAGKVYRTLSANIDGYKHSARDLTVVTKDQLKALSDETVLRKQQLAIGNDTIAIYRRQASEQRDAQRSGVTQYRALLENEARDRRAGLQQLMAISLDEARTRRLGMLQGAAAREDELRTRSSGVTQYRALLENEARDRRAGLQQVSATREDEARTRRLGLQQTRALADDEIRTFRAAEARASQVRKDALFRRLSDLRQAEQAQRAAIDLESRVPRTTVVTRYGSLATARGETTGSTQLAREIQTLAAAHNQVGQAARQSSEHMDRWSKAAYQQHAFARGLAGSLNQLWLTYGTLAPLLAGAAIGATAKAALSAGTELEFQLTFVKALGNESAESIGQLNAAAKNLAKDGLFGVTEIASGMRLLSQAGLSANEQLLAIRPTLDLATVGEMGMADAAVTLVGVLQAFGLNVGQIGHVGDVFAKAAATSQVSVQDMTAAMRTASVVGKQYGASLEDTATALTLLGQLNIKGTAAGTSLRNMLKELFTPTSQAAEQMRKLGIETTTSEGKLRAFPDVIQDLRTELQKYDKISQTNILQNLFGERGAKEAIAMLSQTREQWGKLRGEIGDSAGFIRKVSDELESTTRGSMRKAINTLQVTLVEAFESTGGAAGKLADSLKNLFDSPAVKTSAQNILLTISTVAESLLAVAPAIATATSMLSGVAPLLAQGALLWGVYRIAVMAATTAMSLASGAAGVLGLTTDVQAFITVMTGAAATLTGGTGIIAALGLLVNPATIAAAAITAVAFGIYKLSSAPTDTAASRLKTMGDRLDTLAAKAQSAREAIDKQLVSMGLLDDKQKTQVLSDRRLVDLEIGRREFALTEEAGVNPHYRLEERAAINRLKRERAALDSRIASIAADEKYVADRSAAIQFKLSEGAAITSTPMTTGTKSSAFESFVDKYGSKDQKREGQIKAINDEYNELAKNTNLTADQLKLARERRDAAIAELRKDPSSHRIDKSTLFEVSSIGKQAKLEYQAEIDRIELRDKVAQLLRNNDLLNERDYEDLQNELSDERMAAARARITKEQNEINAQLKTANAETAKALNNRLDELSSEQRKLDTEAETTRVLKIYQNYAKAQGAAEKYADAVAKIAKENASILEQQRAEYEQSKITDPAQLARLKAEAEVTSRYRGELAKIDAAIEDTIKDAEKLAELLGMRATITFDGNVENFSRELEALDARIEKAQGNSVERAALQAQRENLLKNQARDKSLAGDAAAGRTKEQLTFKAGWDRALNDLQLRFADTSKIGEEVFTQMAQTIEGSLAEFLFKPWDKGLQGMLQSFGQMLQQMIAKAVAADLMSKLVGKGNGDDGWLGLAFNAATMAAGYNSGKNFAPVSEAAFTPVAANGLAFDTSGITERFANGAAFTNTIVSRPTTFRFAKGTGLMGEAGPEAIMPLRRGRDGKLGVAAAGGGGTTQSITLIVQVPPGSPPETKRAAGAGAREALAVFQRSQRYG